MGKQDPYIAAVGGITAFTFHADGGVDVEPVELDPVVRDRIEENLLPFYTGVQRSASEVLAEERSTRSPTAHRLDESLDTTRAIGYETLRALESGDIARFGELLTQQWKLKYERQPSDTRTTVDESIELGVKAGAAGGKLVGAGGGGFLLFYADHKAELRSTMHTRAGSRRSVSASTTRDRR